MDSFWRSNCEKECSLRAQVGKTYVTTKNIIGRKENGTSPGSFQTLVHQIQSVLQKVF